MHINQGVNEHLVCIICQQLFHLFTHGKPSFFVPFEIIAQELQVLVYKRTRVLSM